MKRKKKYRPRPVLVNPMGYVLEGMAPVVSYGEYLLDLRVKHASALAILAQGQAKKDTIDILIGGANMTQAFLHMEVGTAYATDIRKGQDALFTVATRGAKLGRFVMTGDEMKAINELFEIHDAQLEIATIKDIDRAIEIVKKEHQAQRVRKIPKVTQQLGGTSDQ